MKINVIGFESAEGISKKTGQPYAIGKLYAALPLAGSKGSKGYMGSEYKCEPSVLKKIEHNLPPFMAEVEFQDVMRFGERQQQIVSIVPTEAKAPGTAVRPT